LKFLFVNISIYNIKNYKVFLQTKNIVKIIKKNNIIYNKLNTYNILYNKYFYTFLFLNLNLLFIDKIIKIIKINKRTLLKSILKNELFLSIKLLSFKGPESVERKLKFVLKLFTLESKDLNSFIKLLKLKTQSQ
jgi:hypothetical protein